MRSRNPFYSLFTFALAGLFLSITGVIGWRPSNSPLSGGRWVEGPIWSQIGLGLACFGVAAIFYRIASRDPRLRS